jgi:hypothetical protein
MWHLIVLDVAAAVVERPCEVRVPRIDRINDSSKNLGELAAVQFCRFPIALDETPLYRYKFIYQLLRERRINDGPEQPDQCGGCNERQGSSYAALAEDASNAVTWSFP